MAGTLRCPENYIPIPLPPLPYKSNTRYWTFPLTETKEGFPYPKKRKPVVTRESRFEQFLCHELYYEYLRAAERAREQTVDKEPPITEYSEQFSRTTSAMHENKTVDLVSKYPVYDSEAISFWNPKGQKPNKFNVVYTISKPVGHQYDVQFG